MAWDADKPISQKNAGHALIVGPLRKSHRNERAEQILAVADVNFEVPQSLSSPNLGLCESAASVFISVDLGDSIALLNEH